MVHDAGEVGDDLAAVGIVGAHAAEPEAVLLCPVEDGERGAGDELVALGGGQAEGVAGFLQREEELGAVGVFPRAGVGGAAAQADDDGQVLDADRALELAGAAGGAFVGGFQEKVSAVEKQISAALWDDKSSGRSSVRSGCRSAGPKVLR